MALHSRRALLFHDFTICNWIIQQLDILVNSKEARNGHYIALNQLNFIFFIWITIQFSSYTICKQYLFWICVFRGSHMLRHLCWRVWRRHFPLNPNLDWYADRTAARTHLWGIFLSHNDWTKFHFICIIIHFLFAKYFIFKMICQTMWYSTIFYFIHSLLWLKCLNTFWEHCAIKRYLNWADFLLPLQLLWDL